MLKEIDRVEEQLWRGGGMIYGYHKWGDERDPPIMGWIHYTTQSGGGSKPILIYPDKVVDLK